jgi:hypothetical protein
MLGQLDKTEAVLRFVAEGARPRALRQSGGAVVRLAKGRPNGDYIKLNRHLHREEYEHGLTHSTSGSAWTRRSVSERHNLQAARR